MNQELKNELMELPEKIKLQEISILSLTNEIETLKNLLEVHENKLEKQVYDEKDLVTGKSAYTNAEMRKNALQKLMWDDGECGKLSDQKVEKEKQLKELLIDLNFLKNKFRALLTIAKMMESGE